MVRIILKDCLLHVLLMVLKRLGKQMDIHSNIYTMTRTLKLIPGLFGFFLFLSGTYAQERLLDFPDQWKFDIPTRTILLTSDQQLIDLTDPDKKIELTLRLDPVYESLREICEDAQKIGCHTLKLAFDNFFHQYRQEGNSERNLTPDSDEFIGYVAKISKFMEGYGLGLELSLLSPLEIGNVYTKTEGESGRWLHYTVDQCDSITGKFSAKLWEQLSLGHNKGKIRFQREGIRIFAFKETTNYRNRYRAVDPENLVEITEGIGIEEWPGTAGNTSSNQQSRRIRIFSDGSKQLKGYDRILVVLSYTTPEMDYFSPNALPYLKNLVKKYHDAGINLNAFYSDEMHIQAGTNYTTHHDYGQFCQRYMTRNMALEYSRRYGAEYSDMDKYMLYFAYGPAHFEENVCACRNNIQYVMGDDSGAIQKTALFRDRYYKLLNEGVVDLFLEAKHYAEVLYGHELLTRAHATWAQSPTIDTWESGLLVWPSIDNCKAGLFVNDWRYKYEYTPNFVWSNTVHQAAAACYDYWKGGEYLTAMGTDHTEGGWSDRNYYAGALAASFGMTNKYPNSYNAVWGMPEDVRRRLIAIYSAYGSARALPAISHITERVHRDVDVLMLYPMNLVASEERFGSWMTQYGYTNYLTTEKVVELGELTNEGKLRINGHEFSTLVALFEPLPDPRLLTLMDEFMNAGGTVIWSGPPPIINNSGESCLNGWQDLFGVRYEPAVFQGKIAAGKKVTFMNDFEGIPEQVILTDFLVDHVYPVNPTGSSRAIARVHEDLVGTLRETGQGRACFLGFRPRDDQSQSLGYEVRTLFEILNALNAYPPTGIFPETNDNTEYVSRNSEYLCTRFPNSTNIIARHYRTHAETWYNGYGRDRELDLKILAENPLPPDDIKLEGFKVNGHSIDFEGSLLVAFRLNEHNELVAFNGKDCDQISIDGMKYVFANHVLDEIAWAPVEDRRQLPGKAFFMVYFEGQGEVEIPLTTSRKDLQLFTEGDIPGTMGKTISFDYQNNKLQIQLTEENTGRWLYLTGTE